MVAAQKIYPDSLMALTGAINENVREFLSLHGDFIQITDPGVIDREAVSRVVVVDTKNADRLGDFCDLVKKKKVEVLVFDHHPGSEADMHMDQDFTVKVGSTTTILVEILRARATPMTHMEATLFALGIHEDTGSLTYQGTTARDVNAMLYLMDVGVHLDVLAYFLERRLSTSQRGLLYRLISNVVSLNLQGVTLFLVRAESKQFVEGVSLVVAQIARMERLPTLFALVKVREKIYVSGISANERVPVGNVLKKLGGGGHPSVGSAVLRTGSLEEAESRLRSVLEEEIHPAPRVSDIMSTYVKTVIPQTSIIEAGRVMRETGYTGLPVVDEEGILVGMISRADTDKAAHHGLGHAPVKGFMSQNPIWVSPGTYITRVQELMVENRIGRVPVVKDGELKGIVTRTDILAALHGSGYLGVSGPLNLDGGEEGSENLAHLMKDVLPQDVLREVRDLGRLAKEEGLMVYLVGGLVRDLLLGVSNLDLDLVVEGDAITFACKVFDEMGGELRTHRAFKTAVWINRNGRRIDIASARREYYEEPAALPRVELTSLARDLYRRDFTINAMAVSINPEEFGQLQDYFGGRRDLERGLVRILHNLSFVEDPTRIFRAVRFEQRYGFKMEAGTEILARRAIDMELVGRLTGQRVRDELKAILNEKTASLAVGRLHEFGIFKRLHPAVELTDEVLEEMRVIDERFEEVNTLFKQHPRSPEKWLVSLLALISGLSGGEVRAFVSDLRFKKKEMIVLEGRETIDKAVRTLDRRRSLKKSEVYDVLDKVKPEHLAYLSIFGSSKVHEYIELYLNELYYVRTELDGKDLMEMDMEPSPLIGEVLQQLRAERLDGLVHSKEDEIELARKLARKAGRKK